MAYALHRRAAFRQSGPASGWAFDLRNATCLNSATLLKADTATVGGTALTPYRLFLPDNSSFLIAQGLNSANGYRLLRYDFPVGGHGDVQQIQNAHFSLDHISPHSYRPVTFSFDGRHYACQGATSDAASTRYIFYSCPLDSPFDISSIRADADKNSLSELTSQVAGLAFSSDGMQLIVLMSNDIRSYYLQEAFDISSASLSYLQVALTRFTASCGISTVVNDPGHFRDLQFSQDGQTLVLLWSYGTYATATGVFFVFKLSVPFNLSTLALAHVWNMGTNYVNYFTIDRSGTNLYVARDTTVMQYALSA